MSVDLGADPVVPERAAADPMRLMAVCAVVIGVANYGMSWAAVRLLPAAEFADYAAVQGFLLVMGAGSLAAIPWAVARYVARADGDDAVASAGMRFGLAASAVQAVIVGPVALIVVWSVTDLRLGIAAGAGAALISLMAGPIGWVQGRGDFLGLIGIRLIETFVRIAAGLGLVLVIARHADFAVIGFPIGSALALAFAFWRCRSAFPLVGMSWATASQLLRQAILLGAVQVELAALGALDTVYAAAGSFTPEGAASYQAAALLGRVPLFFSSAISIAVFPALAAATTHPEVGRRLRTALRTFAWISVPFVLGCLTVPSSVLDLVIPAEYTDARSVLRILCVTGVLIGALNVATTAHQAQLRYRSCLAILGGACVVQAVVLLSLGRTGDVVTFALGGGAVVFVGFLLVVADGAQWFRGAARPTWSWWYPAIAGGAALLFTGITLLWWGGIVLASVGCLALAFAARRTAAVVDGPSSVPA